MDISFYAMLGWEKHWIWAMVFDALDTTGPLDTTGHSMGDGTPFFF